MPFCPFPLEDVQIVEALEAARRQPSVAERAMPTGAWRLTLEIRMENDEIWAGCQIRRCFF